MDWEVVAAQLAWQAGQCQMAATMRDRAAEKFVTEESKAKARREASEGRITAGVLMGLAHALSKGLGK